MTPKRGRKTKGEVFGYDGYLSPFTWRYGTPEMRSIFSEEEKRATWRKVWLGMAEAQHGLGLVSREELEDIRHNAAKDKVDIGQAHRIERKIRHDLMAELKTFAGQAKQGGRKLHLGMTSSDVEDNSDIVIYARAMDVVLSRLVTCLAVSRVQILRHRDLVCMAWTHLQPAEPTTLGYRLANYAQDLAMDVALAETVRERFLMGKGIKGAVGTSASFKALVGSAARVKELEQSVMAALGLGTTDVATQTYPRKVDYLLLMCLASIAQSCHKFGLDLRVLQSPVFGELSEPVEDLQVGSSAMPFKRNPVMAERMCSLARLVSVLPQVAFSNAASSILERTLDDSASRRVAIPEAFLAVDECLLVYERLLGGLRVYPRMMQRNLKAYGPFAGTEAVMMKLVGKGEDRQKVHEMIRVKSRAAWEDVVEGRSNPLEKLLASDKLVSSRLTPRELHALMDPVKHTGDAREKSNEFVKNVIDPILARYPGKRVTRRPRY